MPPVTNPTRLRMNATRILPDLQCSLLWRNPPGGHRELFPDRRAQFHSRAAGAGGGAQVEPVQSLDGGRGEVCRECAADGAGPNDGVAQREVKFALQDAALHATNVTVFGQVEFKTAGTYYVEVLVDDVMKLRYPVPVILAPAQSQPQAPQPPQRQRPEPCPSRRQPKSANLPGSRLRREELRLLPRRLQAIISAANHWRPGLRCAVIWFLQWAWIPTISEAVRRLPPTRKSRRKIGLAWGFARSFLAKGLSSLWRWT